MTIFWHGSSAASSPAKVWGFSIPHGLQPSAIPVTIICGPPASGKSTWVRQQAKPCDLVIDFDVIRCAVGGTKWDERPEIISAAFARRAELLHSLATRTEGRCGAPAHAACVMPVETTNHDPLVDLCRCFAEAYDALGLELKKPEAGNFDTPECLRLMAIKDDQTEQIEATPIATVAGASALLDFIWLDCGVEGSDWVDLQKWAFVKLRGWANAEARELVGAGKHPPPASVGGKSRLVDSVAFRLNPQPSGGKIGGNCRAKRWIIQQ